MALIHTSCRKKGCTDPVAINFDNKARVDDGSCYYSGTSVGTPSPLEVPATFAQYINPPYVPANNPQTVEGVALGRKLFYDPILSGDGTQACASCHAPSNAFVDTNQFSIGIDGLPGTRNAMPIFNLAWNWDGKFFWDGRAYSLENQAFGPVTDPVEMHNTWPNAVAALQMSSEYPGLFEAAFGTSTIDSVLVAKAIAQFERTLISGDSKFDKYLRGELVLSASEFNGFNIFMSENGGDCFHCHGSAANPLWTDNLFHNNGLDLAPVDPGLAGVTGDPNDHGKFRTPSLRNLVFTAPYMHDGRFSTIDDVIEHYSSGVVVSPTIDPLMQHSSTGGVGLSAIEKQDLKAFLLTLTDSSFVTNPDFQAP